MQDIDAIKKKMLEFLSGVVSYGGYALQDKLDLDDETFERAKAELLEEKKIVIGPGYGGSVRLIDDKRVEANAAQVLGHLKKKPGSFFSNKEVMKALSMREDDYWRAAYLLRSHGLALPGVGHGGRIKLAESYPPVEKFEERLPEGDLIKPLLLGVESLYGSGGMLNCDECLVEDCSRLGKKKTGGTWSRPDIVALMHKKYMYSKNVFELHSYEVKCSSAIDITGVYEALAHKKWVHRASLIIHIPRYILEYDHVREQITLMTREASLRGVGFIVFENPYDSSTWKIYCEAEYAPPAPELLEVFMENRGIPQDTLEVVREWLKSA
ncbi:MAG: hypothetical protein LBH94_07575 [Deltaproteobacteria bacterium]|jgi:hypothetical protein|nr:hypothetical protein [Deltaproteobacteria bacterium]